MSANDVVTGLVSGISLTLLGGASVMALVGWFQQQAQPRQTFLRRVQPFGLAPYEPDPRD